MVQFTRSNAFCQYEASTQFLHTDILRIPIAPLVALPFARPSLSFPSTSSVFHSVLLLSVLTTIFAVRAMVAAFCSFCLLSGHQCSFIETLGPLPSVICVVDQLCHYSETIFSEQFEYIPSYIICSVLIPHLLDRLASFALKNIRACVVCIHFLFKFNL